MLNVVRMKRRADRLWINFGQQVRDARLAKRLSVRDVATAAQTSAAMLYRIEAGEVASTDTAQRVAAALGRRAELQLIDPRRREARPNLSADPVHSAMGEYEASHLRAAGWSVGIDEPYQHYQFAGRADMVAWDLESAALLHIENRTRFPDFQDMAGAYNAKRAYLGAALAQRLVIPRWRSETHVIAALWSAEVLRALRRRTESFRSLCPDTTRAFERCWTGALPERGTTSTMVVLDPLAAGRQRVFMGLEEALNGARPRHRGYSEVASMLEREA